MKHYIYIATLLFVIASLVGLAAPNEKLFDYGNHFRPQLVAGGLVLLFIAAVMQARLAPTIIVLALLLNGGLMGLRILQSMPERSFADDKSVIPLTLLSSNVLIANPSAARFLATVDATDPDIIIVVELGQSWAKQLEALHARYPNHTVLPRQDSFGMALYAKWPFKTTLHEVGDYKLPLLQADFPQFTVLAIHPVSPVGYTDLKQLDIYLATAGNIARASTKPVIVAGDYNTTLWAAALQPIIDSGLTRIGRPFNYTWPKPMPPLAIQIDHVFAKGGITGTLQVLPPIGSDHFPILARLKVPGSN